jgi:putative ABC transport system permease protein
VKQLLSDFRYGTRMMKKAKLFAVIAVLTLAIGIGANTAIFSVIYGVLLRPLPFNEPDRLVQIWHTPPQSSFPGMKAFSVSAANYLDWKAESKSFEKMAITSFSRLNLSGNGEPQPLRGRRVSPDFFSALQVSPMLGRTIAEGEDQPGHEHVIVLSHALWTAKFGADASLVGRNITLDETPYTVIGVMARDFRYPEDAEFWVPLAFTPAERTVRGEHHYSVVARLKPGVDIHSAQSEMDTISRRLEQLYPVDNKGWGAITIPLKEDLVGDVRPALLVLLGSVVFVLLIACVNVANLMLAKILDRRKEIAIRNALGASRARIIQQVLSESVVLSIVGGILGAALAYFGVHAIVTYLADRLPRAADITVDWRVLVFTLLISVVAGILTGLAPALRLSKVNVSDELKRGGGRGAETGGKRTRSTLVVAEVALSLMLLAGAGLLLRSLWKLQSVDPGFDIHNVLTASFSVPETKLPTPQQAGTFYQQILQNLRNVPGVESAALIDDLPLAGGSMQPIAVEGRPAAAMSEQPEMPVRRASSDYFRTMRIRVDQGREFNDNDVVDRPRVVIVSKSFAKRYWPNENPIGKHLTLSFFQGGPREVVGIVDDVKVHGLDMPEDVPTVYTPAMQPDLPDPSFGEFRAGGLYLVVRTKTNPTSLVTAVDEAVHKAAPGTPVAEVQTLEQFTADSLAPQRFNFFLLGTFAALALLLATLGIYSVLAYSVRRRTQEIGIRIAMGAQIRDVLRLVLGEGMGLVMIGVVSGLVGTFILSRFLQSMLYNVGTTDLPTFLGVAVLLSIIALGACYLPARRAMRINPVNALRDE